MIDVAHLYKYYGEQCALKDVSFSIEKGEIVGFLGPNGAGKSTTMKILTGFMPPTEGTVQIAGLPMEEESLAIRKKIGYLPENNPLYLDFTVEEFLRYILQIRDIPKNAHKEHIEHAVEKCGLQAVYYKGIGTLSKGYRQRVGLAQALVHKPDILILDEPTSGLDPKQIIEIRDLISHIGKEHTVLLSTHIMQEVKAMCSRVMVISRGEIVAKDTVENLEAHATGASLIEIVLEGNKEHMEKKLSELEGVQKVAEHTNHSDHRGIHRFTLNVEQGKDIREGIFKTSVDEGWVLLESTPTKASLEDVFLELTK